MRIQASSILNAVSGRLNAVLRGLDERHNLEGLDLEGSRDSMMIATGLLETVEAELLEMTMDSTSGSQWAKALSSAIKTLLILHGELSSFILLYQDESSTGTGADSTPPLQASAPHPPVSPFDRHQESLGAGNTHCQSQSGPGFPHANETPRIAFSAIIGNEAAKSSLWDNVILPFTLDSNLRSRYLTGIRSSPGNVILFGPPGCAKTLLAMATAYEARARFFSVRPSDILSKYVGESERTLRSIFSEASRCVGEGGGGSIIFFDEFDSIALCRGGSDEGIQARRLLSELLLQMTLLRQNANAAQTNFVRNGIGSDLENEGRSFSSEFVSSTPPCPIHQTTGSGPRPSQLVVVIAATNRMNDLDEAIIRRFESRVHVGLPSQTDRVALILNFLKGISHGLSDNELSTLGEITAGWSGSDIESWTREACMGPLRDFLSRLPIVADESTSLKVPPVMFEDFSSARQKMLLTD